MAQPNILEYLPDFLRAVKEIQIHAAAESPELTSLWEANDNAYNDQFLYLMGENGISRWEKMIGISPFGTDTLEDRRFRIINRLNAQLPYSYKMLESHLIQMCGETGYRMSYDKDTFTLTIKIALTSKKQYDEILELVNQMIPLNIVLDYDLLYNNYNVLSGYTHAELSAHTHGALRNEVIN